MRRGGLEDVEAVAELAEVGPAGADARPALHEDKDDLGLAGRLGHGLARGEAVEAEADVAPAGGRGGDVVHLAAVAGRMAEKRAHVSRPAARAMALRAVRPMPWYSSGLRTAGSCSASITSQPE